MAELKIFFIRFLEIAVLLFIFSLGLPVFFLAALYIRPDGKSASLNEHYPEPNSEQNLNQLKLEYN